MKIRYYIVAAATLGLIVTSCGNSYEKTVEKYVQSTDGQSNDTDIKFKEVKEVKKVTVGDSIAYLEKTESLKIKKEIAVVEQEKAKYQQEIVNTKNKVLVDAYTEAIVKTQKSIDSLKSIQPIPITLYKEKKTEDILAIIVEASYTITSPDSTVDILANFVLSPDGKECYGVTQNPTMSVE